MKIIFCDEIHKILLGAVGLVADVKVQTNKDGYKNCFVNQIIDTQNVSPETGSEVVQE